jgi:hypothetical protein
VYDIPFFRKILFQREDRKKQDLIPTIPFRCKKRNRIGKPDNRYRYDEKTGWKTRKHLIVHKKYEKTYTKEDTRTGLVKILS